MGFILLMCLTETERSADAIVWALIVCSVTSLLFSLDSGGSCILE